MTEEKVEARVVWLVHHYPIYCKALTPPPVLVAKNGRRYGTCRIAHNYAINHYKGNLITFTGDCMVELLDEDNTVCKLVTCH